MNFVRFDDERNGAVIGRHIACAHTAASRLVGLLKHDSLASGAGIWIRPSFGVHTFGMRFTIDAVGLDEQLRVLKLWRQLRPRRVTGIHLRVKSVLELAAGEIARLDICLGDQLNVREELPQRL